MRDVNQMDRTVASNRTEPTSAGTDGRPSASVACRQPMSFREGMMLAEKQVGPDRYRRVDGRMTREAGVADTCVRVMADVYSKSDAARILIDGEERTAADVKEVYRLLTPRAVFAVIEEINVQDVRYIRAYLRTALYNAGLSAGLYWEGITVAAD